LALPVLEFRQMLAQRAPERYAEISERSGSNDNFDPEPLAAEGRIRSKIRPALTTGV
jgi:hypothetical protein